MTGWMTAVLQALNAAGVRYLTVGGVAVVLHGHRRLTADLDLVLDLAPDNARLAMETLTAAGYQPTVPVQAVEFADPRRRAEWIRTKHMVVFQLWHPGRRGAHIDVFIDEPFEFAQEYARAIVATLSDAQTRIPRIETLIHMKRRAGRDQDLADARALEVLRDAGSSRDNAPDA